MSKSNKTIYYNPSSSIKLNGQDKAGINVSPFGTSGYYNMDDSEEKAYNYAGEQFALNLPELNVFDADTQRKFDNQVQSYINQGVDDINDIYTPMLEDLQNDIASRFGNLDNSVFMDNLSDIEDSRAEAVSALSQDSVCNVLAAANIQISDSNQNLTDEQAAIDNFKEAFVTPVAFSVVSRPAIVIC